VMIRMGDYPSDALVPTFFNDQVWEQLNNINCAPVAVEEDLLEKDFRFFPNPITDFLNIEISISFQLASVQITVFDLLGNQLLQLEPSQHFVNLDLSNFPKGAYFVRFKMGEKLVAKKVIRS